MPRSRLSETENKRVTRISGLKSGRSRLRSLRVICYERLFLKQYLTHRENEGYNIFQVVAVAYGRWSFTRSGHYDRVDSKVPVKSGKGPEHRYLPIIDSLIDILDFLVL